MTTQLTTRITPGLGATVKGSLLSNAEIDNNFISLNVNKLEKENNLSDLTDTAAARDVLNVPARDGSDAFGTWSIVVTGNAGSATQLQNTRKINGTNFNGTDDITTVNWGAARDVTIGETTRSVNGSTNLSWSLSDIGVNNGTLTLKTSGIATGLQTFTANQDTNVTFTVDVPGTNLNIEGSGNDRSITSSTGDDVSIPVATTSNAGFMSTGDKDKLDGIAAGAQVNVGTNLGSSGTGNSRTITSSTGNSTTISFSASDFNAVTTTGNQTIDGTKTFIGILRSRGENDDSSGNKRTGTTVLRPATAEGSNRTATIRTESLTSNRTYTFPNSSGEVILSSGTQTIGGSKTFTSRTAINSNTNTSVALLSLNALSNAGSGATLLYGEISSNTSNRYFMDFRGSSNSSDWRVSTDGTLRSGVVPTSRLSGTISSSQISNASITLSKIETISAGNQIRSRLDTRQVTRSRQDTESGDSGFVLAYSFDFMQSGTIRVQASHRSIRSRQRSEILIRRIRNGQSATLVSHITGTGEITHTVNTSIRHGDRIEVLHRSVGGNSGRDAEVEIKDIRLLTNGENLFSGNAQRLEGNTQ